LAVNETLNESGLADATRSDYNEFEIVAKLNPDHWVSLLLSAPGWGIEIRVWDVEDFQIFILLDEKELTLIP
jgi:hypothetical protein